MAGSSVLGFSRFIRHYSGNHSCFLFLRLLICLNSAGSPPWCQVERWNIINNILGHKQRMYDRQVPTRHTLCSRNCNQPILHQYPRVVVLRHSTALSGHLNLTVIWCITDQTIKKMDLVSTDPDTRVGVQWAHTCNMRSNCRCSCVLQFTLCHAFSCVLHRPPIQLIHCMALYRLFSKLFPASQIANIYQYTHLKVPKDSLHKKNF